MSVCTPYPSETKPHSCHYSNGSVSRRSLRGASRSNRRLQCLPFRPPSAVAIEVQDRGNIPDLVARLKVIAPFCHYLIIISDEQQIQKMREFIAATGDEKAFKAKTVWMTPKQLNEVRQQVSHLSSVLTPSEHVGAEEVDEGDPDADDSEVD